MDIVCDRWLLCPFPAVVFDEAEGMLIAVAPFGQVLRWSLQSKSFVGAIDLCGPDGEQCGFSRACLSRDRSRLAWAPFKGASLGIVLSHRLTGEEVTSFGGDKVPEDIQAIALSPDGQHIAVISDRNCEHLRV